MRTYPLCGNADGILMFRCGQRTFGLDDLKGSKPGPRATSIFLFVMFLITLFAMAAPPTAMAADQENAVVEKQVPPKQDPMAETISTLESILESEEGLRKRVKETQGRMRFSDGNGNEEQIKKEISDLQDEMSSLGRNFEKIATGVDMKSLEARPKLDFNWQSELEVLMAPIIYELKSMTERPREIERLKRELDFYTQRIPAVDRALSNLASLRNALAERKDSPAKKDLLDRLNSLDSQWRDLKQRLINDKTVAEHQFNEKMSDRTSLFDSISNLFALFFKSRGRHLLVAILVALAIYLAFRIFRKALVKISPLSRKKRKSFYLRLGEIMYLLFTIVASLSGFVITLYMYSDWVLIGITLIFLLGLLWAARNGLALFYKQVQLLLNLGAVRENEKVVIDGLTWRVDHLDIFTELVNPELKGGRIRMSLTNLVDMRSRRIEDKEPWFPCRENDWVILSDGEWGKVVTQTPETVVLILKGGTRKFYNTSDFLGMTPMNISSGFRIRTTFGLDYKHQESITKEIPDTMLKFIEEKLNMDGYEKALVNLKVEFETAGASSLDLRILADFKGDVADKYRILERGIPKYAVDACTTYGWEIPFSQLTVHSGDA